MTSHTTRRRPAGSGARRSLMALALVLVTGCGSTVQQASPGGVAPGQAGLTTDGGPAGSELGGAPSVVQPGSSATAPSAGGATGGGATGGGNASGPGSVASVPAGSAAVPGPQGAPGAPADPGQGAGDRTPLKLGLIYVNNDAAAGAGVDNNTSFGPRRVLEALVRATNARGGLAGRKVMPTYFEMRSSSSSYSADLQAACARFVDDARVALVMSFLGLAEEQLSACLTKAGIAHLNGSYALGDDDSISSQPLTSSPIGVGADRRLKALLERMSDAAHLTRTSRIGVLIEGCPYNQRANDRTLAPTARALGLNVLRTRSTRCFGGINDLSGLASDAQAAVLDFATQDIDRVIFVSAVEGNLMLVFATAAESQQYRPGYALSSLAIPNVIKDNVPREQLVGVKGVGWLPALDDAGDVTPTPAADACVSTLKSQGVSPSTRSDHYFAFSPCDAFGLAAQVLAQSRGDAGASRWNAGLDAVGTGFVGASVLEGRTDFRDRRREGPGRARAFSWAQDCSCFRYTGGSFPL